MEDIEHIPQELQLKPKCLIVLTGLDVVNNPSHASIWKGFAHNRGHERAPFKFRNLPITHEYPKPKLKHASRYDWFLPKGLLKRSWMKKHLDELPAVVAIFFDLEWDEKQWDEKADERAKHVELVRSNLASSNTKIVVVLIQKHVRAGDDLNSSERAHSLCLKFQIPVKALLVLQLAEFVFGCITRIETELHELASSYYHNAAKRVKTNMSHLNKSTHQLLVRHEFKIAFFDELKQDPNLALKHYRQSYNHLIELNMPDAHLLEFKVVAGFINYKICRLFFQLTAQDAITQFRRHIDFFKTKVGMPEVAFEHEAWLSKQFEVFGELFDEATRVFVTPSVCQHPGLYFQEAARHSVSRGQLARQLCVSVPKVITLSSLNPDNPSSSQPPFGGMAMRIGSSPVSSPEVPIVATPSTEFYGQRTWRNAGQNVELLEPAKESEGIYEVQKKEAQVCHSNIIIPLLACACKHFERHKVRRMRLYPSFLIAEQYYLKEDYKNALKTYTMIVDDFRHSGWALLFTSVCRRIVECALLTQNYSVALSTSLELIGDYSTLSPAEKEQIQDSVFKVANASQNDFFSDQLEPSNQITSVASDIIDVTRLKFCVDVKVEFCKSSFTIDEPVKLLVFFRSFAPLPLSFASVAVKLINKKVAGSKQPFLQSGPVREDVYTTTCNWDKPINFTSLPSEHFKVLVFTLDPTTLASSVQVEAVEAVVSYPVARCAYRVHWSIPLHSFTPLEWSTSVIPCNYMAKLEALKRVMTSTGIETETTPVEIHPLWIYLANQPMAEITPRKSKLELSLRHTPPVLCNERYAVLCLVQNTEPSKLSSFALSATLSDSSTHKQSDFSDPKLASSLRSNNERIGQVVVGQDKLSLFDAAPTSGSQLPTDSFWPGDVTLNVGVEFICPIYIRCAVTGDRSLVVDAAYSLTTELVSPSVILFSVQRPQESDTIHLRAEDAQLVPTGNTSTSCSVQTRCVQSKRVQLSTVAPFDISSRILSLQNAPIHMIIADKAFILAVSLTNSSPWNVEIDCSGFALSRGVEFLDGASEIQISAARLQPYECVTEVQVLVVPDAVEFHADTINLGQYSIQWRRIRPQTKHGSSFPRSVFCLTNFQLPSCPLAHLPFDVNLQLPAYGLLNKPFSLAYTVVNKTAYLQELSVQLEQVNHFVFGGSQLISLRLLPNTSRKLDYTLLPHTSGYLELPRIHVWSGPKSAKEQKEVPATLMGDGDAGSSQLLRLSAKTQMLRQLRSHIFIKPNREVTLTDC